MDSNAKSKKKRRSSKATKDNCRYYLHVTPIVGKSKPYYGNYATYIKNGLNQVAAEKKSLAALMNLNDIKHASGEVQKTMLYDQHSKEWLFVEKKGKGRIPYKQHLKELEEERLKRKKPYMKAYIVCENGDIEKAELNEKRHPINVYVNEYRKFEDGIQNLIRKVALKKQLYAIKYIIVYHEKRGKIGFIHKSFPHFIPEDRELYDSVTIADEGALKDIL